MWLLDAPTENVDSGLDHVCEEIISLIRLSADIRGRRTAETLYEFEAVEHNSYPLI